jgi:hypothetical protein
LTDGATSYAIPTNDTVEVHTADPAGNPAAEPFAVMVFC